MHVEACLEASRDGGSNPPASIFRRSHSASYEERPELVEGQSLQAVRSEFMHWF